MLKGLFESNVEGEFGAGQQQQVLEGILEQDFLTKRKDGNKSEFSGSNTSADARGELATPSSQPREVQTPRTETDSRGGIYFVSSSSSSSSSQPINRERQYEEHFPVNQETSYDLETTYNSSKKKRQNLDSDVRCNLNEIPSDYPITFVSSNRQEDLEVEKCNRAFNMDPYQTSHYSLDEHHNAMRLQRERKLLSQVDFESQCNRIRQSEEYVRAISSNRESVGSIAAGHGRSEVYQSPAKFHEHFSESSGDYSDDDKCNRRNSGFNSDRRNRRVPMSDRLVGSKVNRPVLSQQQPYIGASDEDKCNRRNPSRMDIPAANSVPPQRIMFHAHQQQQPSTSHHPQMYDIDAEYDMCNRRNIPSMQPYDDERHSLDFFAEDKCNLSQMAQQQQQQYHPDDDDKCNRRNPRPLDHEEKNNIRQVLNEKPNMRNSFTTAFDFDDVHASSYSHHIPSYQANHGLVDFEDDDDKCNRRNARYPSDDDKCNRRDSVMYMDDSASNSRHSSSMPLQPRFESHHNPHQYSPNHMPYERSQYAPTSDRNHDRTTTTSTTSMFPPPTSSSSSSSSSSAHIVQQRYIERSNDDVDDKCNRLPTEEDKCNRGAVLNHNPVQRINRRGKPLVDCSAILNSVAGEEAEIEEMVVASGIAASSQPVHASSKFPTSIKGESRLNIKFISLGEVGDAPQRFGKNNCGIPHNLSGTHEMYDQPWKFEVYHVNQGKNIVLITWKITNLISMSVLAVTETPQDAMVRESCGRTICNMVLKTALDNRAKELEKSIHGFYNNPTRVANARNLIKVLRPKRCTVGLLFFGLLHESVQNRFAQEVTRMGLL